MLNKNEHWIGLLIGLACPAFVFGLFWGINRLTGVFDHTPVLLPLQKQLFVSAALNILPFRYFYVARKLQKTGTGIIFMTVGIILTILLATR